MKIEQRFVRIRQNIEAPEIIDKREALAKSLDEIGFQNMDFVGKTVGITAGSRGIADIPLILSYLVNMIQKKGGIPIIIPAMGTHGGATAERQLKLLDSLGITEQTVGCPIMSKVETQHIGNTYSGVPVYCNVEALKMDLLVPVNRVKSHTDFTGEIESGICKMLAIGLGAHKGAE